MDAAKVAKQLTKQYSWNKFDFGTEIGTPLWRFRYLISCVVVGGNREDNTLKFMGTLFARYETPLQLANASWSQVMNNISKAGLNHSGAKASYVIGIARALKHNGDIPSTREGLEALPGVGRHVASVILATCFGDNEFGVDIHVRRIAKRMGLVDEKATDLRIEREIVKKVPAKMLGHFSRAFVDFGQDICGFEPRCSECGFATQCPSRKKTTEAPKGSFKVRVNVKDGSHNIGAYTVNVVGGFGRCTCIAAKYGKACKHVKELV